MENSSSVSLLELNSQIKSCLHKGFMAPVWVRAEINQYNEHYSGHCYIELIEKGANTDSIQASVRATIWASAFRRIKAHFETSTGQCLSEGIKVLVRAHVDYHEVYGISLNIREIDPNYTLGDLARKRLETMRKLEATGIMDMNKELPFPVVPQRIAIISSLSAAGYEDFTNQMQQNKNKIHYYLKLFPATMQGSSVPLSIMAALDKVAEHERLFDVVVVIRGGGSKTDLSHFDDFDLAYYIAQFPLPVITGIGHEKDDPVIDYVAHTRCKTPTAVASYLLEFGIEFESELDWLNEKISSESKSLLVVEKQRLKDLSEGINASTKLYMEQAESLLREDLLQTEAATKQYLQQLNFSLNRLGDSLTLGSYQFLNRSQSYQEKMLYMVESAMQRRFEKENNRLQVLSKDAQFANPDNILKKGYSVSYYKGKAIKDPSEIDIGETIETRVYKGSFKSRLLE